MSDERAGARRDVLAELAELSRHAAEHAELHQTAVEHGREDVAQRACASQFAWLEVARVLRSDVGRE